MNSNGSVRYPRRSRTRDRRPARSGSRNNDYELDEEENEYVLSVELPGFEMDHITVTWDDGLLRVAADHFEQAFEIVEPQNSDAAVTEDAQAAGLG